LDLRLINKGECCDQLQLLKLPPPSFGGGLGWGSTGGSESPREPPPSASEPRDPNSAASETRARRVTVCAPLPVRADLRAALHPARPPSCVRRNRSRRCSHRWGAGGETAHPVDAAADASRPGAASVWSRLVAVPGRAGEAACSRQKVRTRKRRRKQAFRRFLVRPPPQPSPKLRGRD
jgi:hypothetical protein